MWSIDLLFTFSKFLTDEDGSSMKVSAAITVMFDSSNMGMRCSFVYWKINILMQGLASSIG